MLSWDSTSVSLSVRKRWGSSYWDNRESHGRISSTSVPILVVTTSLAILKPSKTHSITNVNSPIMKIRFPTLSCSNSKRLSSWHYLDASRMPWVKVSLVWLPTTLHSEDIVATKCLTFSTLSFSKWSWNVQVRLTTSIKLWNLIFIS